MGKLEGMVAVITGGSAGIGKATAEVFIREGAAVVLVARGEERLAAVQSELEYEGGEVLVVVGDVSFPECSKEVMEKTIETFGKLDILVNNAGMSDRHCSTVRTEDEMWKRNIAVNQTGPFYFCREALKHMTRAGSGNIINISSIGGVYSIAGASYSASKMALIGLTKNIAIQYVGTGIRCNAVCPGPTATDMLKLEPLDMEMLEITGRHVDKTAGISEPIDVANAVLFFASEDSRNINGQVLVIDMGSCL